MNLQPPHKLIIFKFLILFTVQLNTIRAHARDELIYSDEFSSRGAITKNVSDTPRIESIIISPDNRYSDIIFSEPVYTGNPYGGPVKTEDILPFILPLNSSLKAKIKALSQPTGINPGTDTLQGGETIIRVFLEYSGITTGEEVLVFVGAKDSSVCDSDQNYLSTEDMNVTANINYLAPKELIIDTIICGNDSYYAGGDFQDTTGIYFDTLNTTFGYDSIIITQLTVHPVPEIYINAEICEGESYFTYGIERELPGVYIDTLTSALGCDSIIITNLEVFPNYETRIDVISSYGETYFVGGNEQSEPGVYEDFYHTIHGCDSLVITTLEFSEATSYYDISDRHIIIYPVPTKAIINVEFNNLKLIELYDSAGIKLMVSKKKQIDLSDLENGFYYIVIIDNNYHYITKKVVLTH